jgi:hypothetical protein
MVFTSSVELPLNQQKAKPPKRSTRNARRTPKQKKQMLSAPLRRHGVILWTQGNAHSTATPNISTTRCAHSGHEGHAATCLESTSMIAQAIDLNGFSSKKSAPRSINHSVQ